MRLAAAPMQAPMTVAAAVMIADRTVADSVAARRRPVNVPPRRFFSRMAPPT